MRWWGSLHIMSLPHTTPPPLPSHHTTTLNLTRHDTTTLNLTLTHLPHTTPQHHPHTPPYPHTTSLPLTQLIHPNLNNFFVTDAAWAFACYLETWAVIPQVIGGGGWWW